MRTSKRDGNKQAHFKDVNGQRVEELMRDDDGEAVALDLDFGYRGVPMQA